MNSWFVDAVQQFARYMGIDRLHIPENGVFCFHFERSGRFFIEFREEEIILYLARDVDPHREGWMERALRFCHYKNRLPYPVSAGLKGDNTLVFITKLPVEEFNLPTLEAVFNLLREAHNKVQEG